MENGLIQSLIDLHLPVWLLLTLLFLVAFSESLAIVGLIMPGTVLMFIFGALIGLDFMPLWPALLWATLGAILGDGISFFLGYYYEQRLRRLWPFSRYPQLVEKGERFFARHGGKGIVFGRFVGPLRPVLPAVAGMLGMPWRHYLLINLFSAMVWAPFYLFPGILFGTSLELASEVTGRLVILLLLLLSVTAATVFIIRRLFFLLQPSQNPLLSRLLRGLRHYPPLHGISHALLDPEHPEARTLGALSALFIITSVLMALMLQQSSEPAGINLWIQQQLQALRSPGVDNLMVFITQLGSLTTLVPLVAMLGLYLAKQRQWRSLLYLLTLLLVSQGFVLAMKHGFALPRPTPVFSGLHQYSFPSSHSAMSTSIYGFIAIMLAGAMHQSTQIAWRWLPYVLSGLIIALVSFSRLYLGVHWFSDILAGITLGLALCTLFGLAYRHHHLIPLAPWRLTWVVLFTMLVLALLQYQLRFDTERTRYAVASEVTHLDRQEWIEGGWQQLPQRRQDLRHFNNHPLPLQWMASEEEIVSQLSPLGWQRPAPLSAQMVFALLLPQRPITDLPVLPHLHQGRYQDLLLIHDHTPSGTREVLRLWRLAWVDDHDKPLWIGNVSSLKSVHPLGLFSLPMTDDNFEQPLHHLLKGLGTEGQKWRGEVVLLGTEE